MLTAKRLREAEENKKKNELRMRFKRVIRLIIINSQWIEMEESEEDMYEKIFNIKNDKRFLVRTTQKSELFTATDKSLLRTPHDARTPAEQQKLLNLFAHLKCFRDIPPTLRDRLMPVITFLSINAGRTIMRQGDTPHSMVFIVAGNIEMTSTKQVDGEVMFGPGDYIGDVELYEECPRLNTFISKSQCELLVLYDTDFTAILETYMKKVWLDKKRAIKALDYFNFLTDDLVSYYEHPTYSCILMCVSFKQIMKTCQMSTLKQFKPLDTIYSRDKGTLTNVHFVLSGECVILQCLNILVSRYNGKKVYDLDDPSDEKVSEDSESFDGLKEEEERASSINIQASEDEAKKKKKSVIAESHFIDVGTLTFGAIFGLGEKSEHRVIMARDVVQCLMIPRFFLMGNELNPGNIWQRRLFCLNCIIPTREMLFKDYVQNLKWKKFKSKYISEIVDLDADTVNVHDIPVLCRIEAGIA
ncbi:hypothetical protein KR093_008750 [Drosophila rubida]|uniref:Cyclic nucleotide-binding domain-containing protein n=1 Tax=Drosophila rubida TaxID=30044 RepID=A0AAD4K7F4_9MUSC|nr:hypothetical protein KR093_008750 [Drosophila rubida]